MDDNAGTGISKAKRKTKVQTVYKENVNLKGKKFSTEVQCTLTLFEIIQNKKDFLDKLSKISDITFEIEDFILDSQKNITTALLSFRSCSMVRKFEKSLKRKKDMLDFRFEKHQTGIASSEYIENNTLYIMNKATEILQTHEQKVNALKYQHSKLLNEGNLSNENDEKKMEEMAALKEKLLELENQQNEFKKCLQLIIMEIEKGRGQVVLEKSCDAIKRKFDIEYTRLEQALPMYAKKSLIVETVLHNQVSIILGETGSGKSTQMVQYLLQSELTNKGHIICTQPRKVAALTLACRVASELKSNVGDLVGYQTGIQSKVSKQTKVIFMTDHTLLNECLKDPLLKAYSCIIIDEAHERSIYTDLLLGMLKQCLPKRNELRLIITSATIDPDVFVKFFGGCPILKVSGRMFPVSIEWQPTSNDGEVSDDYEEKAIVKAAEVHRTEPPGDILVFLTSQIEIERCVEKLQIKLKGGSDCLILPLHGKLQPDEQKIAFQDSPRGKRKIVLSTNIAETSVTIPGVKYVIDTGVAKELSFDPVKRISSLHVAMVTKSSADQRKGRAGRTGPGKCFRLYSEKDYDEMTNTSIPEILKINMSHAILKLLQLNVHPLEFDFVQSPDKTAMEKEYQELIKLGAVENDKISNLGKWIAKLPFEPNLGVMVHDAIEKEIGLEGIIIAASCTSGSTLFYRSGSNEEKEISDKLKLPFCHPMGDHFTYLKVFKEWNTISEKEKGKWCKKNSINSKAIRGIRDAVKEILFILKKEMDVSLKFQFRENDKKDRELQQLIFKAFKNNICHYLGHENAGYYFIDNGLQVFMHPSSSLVSLASFPDWVIVERVMKTSREFAMNITAVSEEDIKTSLSESSLNFDFHEIKSKRLVLVCKEYVGSQMYRFFVGYRYTNVKKMEKKLEESCPDSIFVISTEKEKGEIAIFSASENNEIASQTLTNSISNLRHEIKSETVEQDIVAKNPCVRVSIGLGGVVKNIIRQNTQVYLYGKNDISSYSEEEIRSLFDKFGKIESCVRKSDKNKNETYWGQITYEEALSVNEAISGMKNNAHGFYLKATINSRANESKNYSLTAAVSWCRRKAKRFGFVQMIDLSQIQQIFSTASNHNVMIDGSNVKIKRGKQIDQLFVDGLGPLANEDKLRRSLKAKFGLSDEQIVKVNVGREQVNTSKELLEEIKRKLERAFEQHGECSVTVIEPKRESYFYKAFVNFSDPDKGIKACRSLNNTEFMDGHRISIVTKLHTRIFLTENVYKCLEKQVEEYSENVQKEYVDVKLRISPTRKGSYAVNVDGESIENLSQIRRDFQEITQSESVSNDTVERLEILFTKNGRNKVRQIMLETETFVTLDERKKTVLVFGKKPDRMKAVGKLTEYLKEIDSCSVKIIDLKGKSKPPGLMKEVIAKFGLELDGLKTLAALSSVQLDHKSHRIKLHGDEHSVNLVVKELGEITNKLNGNKREVPPDMPECGICFCEILEMDLYRLESCGHPYCKSCIHFQIESSIKSKDFPLACSHETCECHWAWKDIQNMVRLKYCTFQSLVDSSLSCFASENKDKIRYCITPDCPMVYKVSQIQTEVNCSVCETSVCARCHVNYHFGMTCKEFKIGTKKRNEQQEIQDWMNENPTTRKLCPSCGAGIEKNGGCHRVQCLDCKKHICWKCLLFFDNSSDCYQHMSEKHGSYFE